ncbi:MAG: TSUP family transporter [Saprospiraceae bacterium]|nr:TSUP family transporter [Saprospiraceae bacterium]
MSATTSNHLFPVFLKLEQMHLLLIGGGAVALEKLHSIIQNSPATKVKIVAKSVNPEIEEIAETHTNISIHQRAYHVTDMDDVDLVISALNDPAITETIRSDAKNAGLLINAADKPALCDFYLGSVVKKGQLKIAISTNGKSPTVAKRVKEVLNDSFPDEINETLENLAEVKTYLKGSFRDRVLELNKITGSLTEKEYNKNYLKGLILRWSVIFALPVLFITGYFLGNYFPAEEAAGVWAIFMSHIDASILIFIMAGFLASAIDGALGMAYGITATTVLLSFGLSPVAATASVHTSEVFTSGVSGLSHLKFGNVNNKLFRNLLIPGVIGAILGAFLISYFEEYSNVIKPLVSAYTLFLGVIILLKALKKDDQIRKKVKRLFPLAFTGGFLDSVGGGGWGPIVSSTLIAQGKAPRYTIGSVNLTEFFVALASSITFFAMIGTTHLNVILGLILGGVAAAPLGAFLTSKIPAKSIMLMVGIIVIILSIKRIFF